MKMKMSKLQDEMFQRLFMFVQDMETRSDRFEMFAILKTLYEKLDVPNMTLKEVEELVDLLDREVENELNKMNLNDIRKYTL